MERRVIKGFTDKETKEEYPKGSKYVSDDKNRVNELVNKGNLSGEEIKSLKDAQEDLQAKQDAAAEDEPLADVDVKAEDMTMAELKQIADNEGIEVVGSGKNGAIKKEDYIKALEA